MAPQEIEPSVKTTGKLSSIKEKVLHNDGFFFTFLRSSVSSQVCGWIDTITSFLVFSLLDLSAWLSTAIGAFVGGVFNCIINYKFTFHAYGVELRAALAKFAFVWTGSLLLNSFGTQIVYHWVVGWDWLHATVGITDDMTFLAARLFVALMVSLCWNFLLQRNFVFRATRLDPYINQFLDWCGIGKRKHKNEANEQEQ